MYYNKCIAVTRTHAARYMHVAGMTKDLVFEGPDVVHIRESECAKWQREYAIMNRYSVRAEKPRACLQNCFASTTSRGIETPHTGSCMLDSMLVQRYVA